MRKKRKTKIILIVVGFVLVAFSLIFIRRSRTNSSSSFTLPSQVLSAVKLSPIDMDSFVDKKISYAKVTSYKQKVNEDDIAVDMQNNPYFNKKIPGYQYPKARKLEYYSTVTDSTRHASILLPVNYTSDKKYPVLYLMHGLGGSHRTWLNKDADIIIYNLQYFYDAKEMIVVMPDNNVNKEEDCDGMSVTDKVKVYDQVEEDVVKCLMPYVNENYSTLTGKENTAIAGNSMGGRETINIAFNHQDLFGYVGIFSSSYAVSHSGYVGSLPALFKDLKTDPDQGGFKLIMVMVGRSDNVCGQWSYYYHDRLTANNVPHIFYTTEGGHQNKVWQNALYNFGRKIFQK